MSARTLLALSLIFLLAGCGGPTAADYGLPAGIDPDDPEAGRMAVEHMLDTVYETDIDDALLAELLYTHRRVRAAGDDVRRAMAVLAGPRWNGRRYGKAMWKWKMMQEATKKGIDAIQRDIDDLDEQRAGLEAEIAEASGAQRERLEQGLARHAVAASVMRNNGAAHVFFRSGGGWNPQIYVKASNRGASDLFGFSVALDGNTIVAGALQEDGITVGIDGDGADDSATDAGAGYVLR